MSKQKFKTLEKCELTENFMDQLRPPSLVMRLERLGSFFQTRLSFMRVLIRQLSKEGSSLCVTNWSLNEKGFGKAVLTIKLNGLPYSLIA